LNVCLYLLEQNGETLSLTLGGYDANRFVPHNTTFELNPGTNPQAYINSISVSSAASSNNWTVPVNLLYTSDGVSAIIDSSTPYLWLPQAVCDRFAGSLGLTYNETLNIYTFDGNSSQHTTLENAQLTFTFSLSSLANTPTVNITLPYEAFNLQLTYPSIPNTTFGGADSSKYYFPLRPATSQQYTIGRAFLQEAYIITDYERNNFSIHQAVHIANPVGNTSIVAITRPADSIFSGPPSSLRKGLSTGAIVGIVVGVIVVLAISCLSLVVLFRRRYCKEKTIEIKEEMSQPQTFFSRFRRNRPPRVHEAAGCTTFPTEVGADASHERFELPGAFPAELDSESGTLSGTTENGSTQDSVQTSAYERACRRLEHQQQLARQASSNPEAYPIEKTESDVSPVAHYRSSNLVPGSVLDTDSPLISPIGAESTASLPSPVSAGSGLAPAGLSPPPTYRRINPAHVVYAGRIPDNVQLPRNIPKMIGSDGRTLRAEETTSDDSDGSLGSDYTENGEIDMHQGLDSVVQDATAPEDLYGADSGTWRHITGRGRADGTTSDNASNHNDSDAHTSSDKASSDDEGKFLREDIMGLRSGMQAREILAANGSDANGTGSGRFGGAYLGDGEFGAGVGGLEGGEMDLVHIPQFAPRRFSWEEERLNGRD
jgi:hypothetical protein